MKTKMSFDTDYLIKEQFNIDNDILKLYNDPTLDGIIDVNEYCKTPIKILWILKEVNDEDGYNQREAFNNLVNKIEASNSLNNTKRKYWWSTLDPIIYTSFQIIEGFKTWQEISYIQDAPKMVSTLKKIAYINLKKEPGGASTNDAIIEEGYMKSKNIIEKQFNLINPDVIIGGNTLQHIKEDFKLEPFQTIDEFNLRYSITGNRIFIDSCHPQYLSRQNEDFKGEYINAIVQTVKNWYKKIVCNL